jgi:hypothetical protein
MYYGTPPIVTNGLVLNLDAASQKAQPTRNLLNHTTDLTNAAWTKIRCQITASAGIAPDGTNTAFAMTITDATQLVRLTAQTATTSVPGGPYTLSFYIKNNGSTAGIAQLGIFDSGQAVSGFAPSFAIQANFVNTGSNTGTAVTALSANVEPIANGWYRISATGILSSSISSFSTFIDIANGAGGTKVNGESILLWRPQFETGRITTPYQPGVGTTKTWPGLTFDRYSGSYTTTTSRPTYLADNGGSMVFDGVGSQMTLGTGSSYPFPYHTYEIWAKTPGTGSAMVGGAGLVAFDYGRLVYFSPTGQLIYVQTSGSAAVLFSRTTTQTFFDNKWHHIVCSRGVSQSEMYVDGILINSGSSGTAPGWDGLNSWSTMQVFLGDNPNNVTYKLKGSIASVRVYNRQLSQQEVTQNYNALKSRFI